MRSIGHIAWKDKNKWMEAMRGPRWKARMAQENAHFMKELDGVSKEEIAATTQLFKAYSEEADAAATFEVRLGTTQICITPQGGMYKWRWVAEEKEKPLAGELDVTDTGLVIVTEDLKEGGHHYQASAYTKEKTLWTFDGCGDHGLSSDVAILGSRVFFLEAANPLQYKWLVSIDLKTGKDRQVHYEEHEMSVALNLVRGENECLFLLADNAGKQKLFHVGKRGGVQRLDEKATLFYPIGSNPRSSQPSYLVQTKSGEPWEIRGHVRGFPSEALTKGIDFIDLKEEIVVYREHGKRVLYRNGRRVASFWGEICENSWMNWKGGMLDLRVSLSGQTPVSVTLHDGRLVWERPLAIYGDVIRHGFVASADGTPVRWLGAWSSRQRPKALLVIGYGAYGVNTAIDTTRWRLYIERGFAVGFAFIRGGGDHNDVWAEAGRLGGKERGVEDFEACVRGLQRATGVGASRTCMFGRSAGGYLMGLAVMRNPDGELARCVYTEAPYVDVLQTASNQKLPLTVGEYMEFGDPAHKIEDFEMLLRLSPVGGTGPRGAPGVFVLCRVGLNDRQVYAYESVKWMDVLRSSGVQKEKKILYLTENAGHNVHGDRVFEERAQDFLILGNKVLRLSR